MKLCRRVFLAGLPLALVAQDRPPVEVQPLRTSITVVDTIETPSSSAVTVFNEEALSSRPGVNLDDRLRDIPGFSLFRRSSSLVAHPTSQGVALRGIGTSAASRTLILYDALPLNDPFGGWVYWTRLNPESIETVEVSRGVSTSVWGDRSMGGLISVFSPAPANRHVSAAWEAGDAGIVDARGAFSNVWGRHGIGMGVRGFRSDGYYVVPQANRGPVDTRADVDFVVPDFRWDYFRDQDRLTWRTNLLAERRQNGTGLRYNSSSLGTTGLHYRRGGFSAVGYHSRGALHSTFTAVNEAHDVETLATRQKVTFEDSGGSLVWQRAFQRGNLALGADTHRASGLSRDTVAASGFQRNTGGTLWQQGAFLQADVEVGSRTRLYGGLRHDFTDRGNDFWSPRAGISFFEGPLRWRASAYRGFRAPTLNEFFRQFRVGNITTLANPNLRPETVAGADAGVDWRHDSLLVRTTLFWQSINDIIGNATINPGPPPLRQRQNFGSAKGRGVEIEIQKTFGRVRIESAYLYVDAQVDDLFWMPQVPRHQGSAQLLYSSGKTLLSVGIRPSGAQFEDDLNEYLLPGFATLQLFAERRLVKGFSALAAVENLLNREFIVGYTPEAATGTPRLLRVGVRWRSGR